MFGGWFPRHRAVLVCFPSNSGFSPLLAQADSEEKEVCVLVLFRRWGVCPTGFSRDLLTSDSAGGALCPARFLAFIPVGVLRGSWIHGLVSDVNLGKFSVVVVSSISVPSPCLPAGSVRPSVGVPQPGAPSGVCSLCSLAFLTWRVLWLGDASSAVPGREPRAVLVLRSAVPRPLLGRAALPGASPPPTLSLSLLSALSISSLVTMPAPPQV